MKEKKRILWTLFLCVAVGLCGCISRQPSVTEGSEIQFTEVSEQEIPEELKIRMEEEKKTPFMLTYTDGDVLYAARSYGPKEKTGYQVRVDSVVEGELAIRIKTSLMGPEKGEKTKDVVTYPYVVIRLKVTEKEILFE